MREGGLRASALVLVGALVSAPEVRAIELHPRQEPFRNDELLAPVEMEAGQRVPLRDGTLLGDFVLDAPWRDFRGQSIVPGSYSLRYALQPRLKDHLGADAIRDFALLVPREAAPPSGSAGGAAWVAASRRVSATAHPAILALVAGGETGALPAPRREAGGLVLEYREVGDLVLGFVVAGAAERSEPF